MDKLEKYILRNRDKLDMYSPDQKIWDNIQVVSKHRPPAYRKLISIAAALAIMLVTSISLLWYSGNKAAKSGPPELIESELFYSKRVEYLLDEAQPFLTSDPGLGNELMEEMKNLDMIYMELKNDLKDNVSNSEVIEALIVNYRVRIQLLEEMLIILKEEKGNNTKIDRNEI